MKLRLISFISFILFSWIVLNSCEIYNPTEETPSYIHIDSISLVTNIALQGSNSNKITDVWIYIDDQLIGTFELPVTFPILAEGLHQIRVKAGIKMNGIAATRIQYPFYDSYIQTIDLSREKITKIAPVITYSPVTTFTWIEDFESPGISITTINSDTILQKTQMSSDVFEGSFSGVVSLDESHPFFECVSSASGYKLPKAGDPVFLELNYKSNNPFRVGIYANKQGGIKQVEALIINPSDNWNKIYISLTSVVSGEPDATSYKIYLGMLKESSVANPKLLIDNIKLLNY